MMKITLKMPMTMNIAVQFNGKTRGTKILDLNLDEKRF